MIQKLMKNEKNKFYVYENKKIYDSYTQQVEN